MPAASRSADAQPTSFPDTLELALLAFHRNVGPIRKQSEAKYGAFADLRTVLEAITPALLDQGLLLSQSMEPTPDGGCVLRTQLTHAPSGDFLASSCPIPSLDTLLSRVHELRNAALRCFPLDMPLAAAGAVPPILPPRNPDPSAPAPQPSTPPRPPGLRLDDQLKGLYTVLGQLGTTTNPLHALGGTITYLRRYQILTLLSLAPADDDGNSTAPDAVGAGIGTFSGGPAGRGGTFRGGDGDPNADQPSSLPRQQQAQPAPARSRSRQGRGAAAGARPQATPPRQPEPSSAAPATPNQSAPAAAPTSAPAPGLPEQATPPPAAPQPAPQDALSAPATSQQSAPPGHELIPAEVQQLIALIRTLPTESIPHLVTAFRTKFQLPADALVSDYIRTHEHAAFIRSQVAAMTPAAV